MEQYMTFVLSVNQNSNILTASVTYDGSSNIYKRIGKVESSDVDINNMLEDIEENLDLDTLMKQKQMLQKKLGLEGTFLLNQLNCMVWRGWVGASEGIPKGKLK